MESLQFSSVENVMNVSISYIGMERKDDKNNEKNVEKYQSLI